MPVTYELETPSGSKYDVEFENEPTPEIMDATLRDIMREEKDSGQGMGSSAAGAAVRGALGLLPSAVQGVGALFPGETGDVIRRQGQAMQQGLEANVPVNPIYEDATSVKAAGAVGQGLAFLGGALASGGSTLPVLGVAGLAGAAGGADIADQYGLEGWRRGVTTLGAAGAELASESLFGIGTSRFLKGAGRPGIEAVKAIAGEAAEEPIAGALTDVATDMALIGTDKPKPNPFDLAKRGEEALYGAIGAAPFGGLAALNARRLRGAKLYATVDGQVTLLPDDITDQTVKAMGLRPQDIAVVPGDKVAEMEQAILRARTQGQQETIQSVMLGAAATPSIFDAPPPTAEDIAALDETPEEVIQNEEERQILQGGPEVTRDPRVALPQGGGVSNLADLGTPMGDITTDFGPLRTTASPETTNPAVEGSAPGGVGDLGASPAGPATGSSAPVVSSEQLPAETPAVNTEVTPPVTVETLATDTRKAKRNVDPAAFRTSQKKTAAQLATEAIGFAPTVSTPEDLARMREVQLKRKTTGEGQPQPPAPMVTANDRSKVIVVEDKLGQKSEFHQIRHVTNDQGDIESDITNLVNSLRERAKKVTGKVYGKKFMVRVDEERAEFANLNGVINFISSIKNGAIAEVYRNGNNQIVVDFEVDIPEQVKKQILTGEDTVVPAPEVPAALKAEEKKSEKTKQSTAPDNTTLKDQKKYLLDQIDTAIKDAPSASDAAYETEADEDLRQYKASAPHFINGENQSQFNARRAVELAGLFVKYDVPFGKPAGSDVASPGAKLRLEEAMATAKMRQTPRVTIEVPGDGTFRIINTKEALAEFKKRAAKFPTSVPKPQAPTSLPMSDTSKVPAIKNPKTLEEKAAAISAVVSTSDEDWRRPVTLIRDTGEELVATDGKKLIRVEVDSPTRSPGWFNTKGKKVPSPKNSKGEELDFPKFQQVIPPKKNRALVFKGLDTARLFTVLSQAQAALKGNPKFFYYRNVPVVRIFRNPDNTVGFETYHAPQPGMEDGKGEGIAGYEHNMQEGAEFIAGYDVDFLLDLIGAARALGHEKLNFNIGDLNEVPAQKDWNKSPAVLDAPGLEMVIMSVRAENEIKTPIQRIESGMDALGGPRSLTELTPPANPIPLGMAAAHLARVHGLGAGQVDVISRPEIVARGWLDAKTGRPVINVPWIRNADEVSEVLYHEITHRAETDPAMRPDINAFMGTLTPAEISRLNDRLARMKYDLNEFPTERAAMAISEAANRFRGKSGWAKLVQRVRTWWKELTGQTLNRQDAEAVAARIVARAIAQLKAGRPMVRGRVSGNVRRSGPESALPADTEVTITANTRSGPVEMTMDARDAEAMLTKRQSVLQALLDCLNS